MIRTPAVCLLYICAACTHGSGGAPVVGPHAMQARAPALACVLPAEPSASDLVRQHGTILERYQREGGVWLDHAPVLVNEDFDFSLAMGLEGGIGAGLAAARREENNTHKAAALAGLALAPQLQRRLNELRCCGVHAYFVLWGSDSATLRTVIDIPGDAARSRVVESQGRPLTGDGSWMAQDILAGEAQRALQDVACAVERPGG